MCSNISSCKLCLFLDFETDKITTPLLKYFPLFGVFDIKLLLNYNRCMLLYWLTIKVHNCCSYALKIVICYIFDKGRGYHLAICSVFRKRSLIWFKVIIYILKSILRYFVKGIKFQKYQNVFRFIWIESFLLWCVILHFHHYSQHSGRVSIPGECGRFGVFPLRSHLGCDLIYKSLLIPQWSF